jgi:hypothetical protein
VTSERREGPTPHGGVASEAIYLNDANELADKEDATRVEILEFDESGEVIHRTYAELTVSQ